VSGNWPEQVPILSQSDMCKFRYDSKGRRCLLGWVRTVFGHEWCAPGIAVVDAIGHAAGIRALTGYGADVNARLPRPV
jgi:hypothetical protein